MTEIKQQHGLTDAFSSKLLFFGNGTDYCLALNSEASQLEGRITIVILVIRSPQRYFSLQIRYIPT